MRLLKRKVLCKRKKRNKKRSNLEPEKSNPKINYGTTIGYMERKKFSSLLKTGKILQKGLPIRLNQKNIQLPKDRNT